MASDAEKIINDFCKCWSRRNLEEIMSYFADDAVYHNMPVDPARGKDAIRATINTFLPGSTYIEFKILHTASSGDVVFNERVDMFEMDGKRIELPVAGVFQVRNGKIALWRDYFDMQSFTKQMG
jgi:limonene-1,2-epoxide hydrolase